MVLTQWETLCGLFFAFFEKIVVPILTSWGYVGLSIATLLSQHNNRKSPILDDYIEKIQVRLKPWMYAKAAYSDADFVVIAAPTNVYSKESVEF